MIAIKYSKDVPIEEIPYIVDNIRKVISEKRPDEIVIAVPNKIDIDFDYSIEDLEQMKKQIDYLINDIRKEGLI